LIPLLPVLSAILLSQLYSALTLPVSHDNVLDPLSVANTFHTIFCYCITLKLLVADKHLAGVTWLILVCIEGRGSWKQREGRKL
jgi:hypothetical protein